jgi:hypothetical protein
MRFGRAILVLAAMLAAFIFTTPGVSLASAKSSSCSGSPQRCDVTFQSEYNMGYLGIHSGLAITWYSDGGSGQFWDVYQVPGGGYPTEYVIYNHNTNNVVTSSSGCQGYPYCAVVTSYQGLATQKWIEMRTDPMVFQNVQNGDCLNEPSNVIGYQVTLTYFCNDENPSQQWAGS